MMMASSITINCLWQIEPDLIGTIRFWSFLCLKKLQAKIKVSPETLRARWCRWCHGESTERLYLYSARHVLGLFFPLPCTFNFVIFICLFLWFLLFFLFLHFIATAREVYYCFCVDFLAQTFVDTSCGGGAPWKSKNPLGAEPGSDKLLRASSCVAFRHTLTCVCLWCVI